MNSREKMLTEAINQVRNRVIFFPQHRRLYSQIQSLFGASQAGTTNHNKGCKFEAILHWILFSDLHLHFSYAVFACYISIQLKVQLSSEDDPCNASLLLRLKTAKISGFAYSQLKKKLCIYSHNSLGAHFNCFYYLYSSLIVNKGTKFLSIIH